MCPYCKKKTSKPLVKIGFYSPPKVSPQVKFQRFRCRGCQRTFSEWTKNPLCRDRTPGVNQYVFRMLCSGVSQRRTAFLLGLNKETIALKVMRLGKIAAEKLSVVKKSGNAPILFDEMETFEHTKCKPVSIVLAVVDKERRIVGLSCASMPAKGRLAEISRKKYGLRKDDRPKAIKRVFEQMKKTASKDTVLMSDECPRYPRYTKRYFPGQLHLTFKGRRGCVVGQGELKRGGFDPLFSLNHTAAMVRDNLKRMSRRTWCTTKKIERLSFLMNMYACFHNQRLQKPHRPPQLLYIRP